MPPGHTDVLLSLQGKRPGREESGIGGDKLPKLSVNDPLTS